MIVAFYKKLLGMKDDLYVLDPRIVERGPLVQRHEALDLIRGVTRAEIDCVMFSINNDKAQGIYGFNAKFFKLQWDIIKEEIDEAIFDFFRKGLVFPIGIAQWLL